MGEGPHLHDAVQARLEAAQVFLLHFNLLKDLLLVGEGLSVLLRNLVGKDRALSLDALQRYPDIPLTVRFHLIKAAGRN